MCLTGPFGPFRYIGWPAAKAHVAILTGSLRNLQKLVTSIDDDGLLRMQLRSPIGWLMKIEVLEFLAPKLLQEVS